jgi:N-acetylmuramoyl-L-alanine amidase
MSKKPLAAILAEVEKVYPVLSMSDKKQILAAKKYFNQQTFYKDNDQKGLKLANSIQENLNYSIQKENKRTPKKISNIYLSKHLEIPFCLVECGFLSNKSELSLLKTKNYQEILAWGIYTGIMDYFK